MENTEDRYVTTRLYERSLECSNPPQECLWPGFDYSTQD
ncbi:hypothetical protein AVEN_31810-1, partial [Araneus ventricosus]